MLDKDMD